MKPRVSTIVWGGCILLIGALVLVSQLGGLLPWPELDPVAVVVGVIGGLGGLLVLGAIIAAIVSAARRSPVADAGTSDAESLFAATGAETRAAAAGADAPAANDDARFSG